MLLVTATMKRFHQETGESFRLIKKPKHYACPEGKAFIELKGRKHTISVLLDSGSNIFLMNQNTAQRLEIPTEARESPLTITTFDGETVPTGGKFYTHPILLEIGANGHRSMISCEISNAGRYDLIIPFGWWHDEHPLKNIRSFLKRKTLRGWRLEGRLIMPSTLRKGQNPYGAQFTQCRHTS